MLNQIKVIQIIILFLLGGCHHTHNETFDYLGVSKFYCEEGVNSND